MAYAGTDTDTEDFTDYTVPSLDEPAAAPVLAPVPPLESNDEDSWDDSDESGTGSAKAKNAAKSNRTLIRRTAAKAVEIHQAPEIRRELAAALLGSGSDTAELTVAVMTAGRASGSALADITEIRTAIEENPMAAGVLTLSLGKAGLKGVWTILHTLGAVGKAMNASEAKAAMEAGAAIGKLDAGQLAELDAAGELIKR